MKFALAAAAALSLILCSSGSFAEQQQQTRKENSSASVAGTACTTGQTCAANCDTVGWCSRMVCFNNKWEKRLVSCVGSLCPPKC